MNELHVSELYRKTPIVCAGDYALSCGKYAHMVGKPWQEWGKDEACFGGPDYMENADFFCKEYNKAMFGKERIEAENQEPWWNAPAFVLPKKNIYGIS